MVEIFHRGKLVATHLRSLRRHRRQHGAGYMPSSHAPLSRLDAREDPS